MQYSLLLPGVQDMATSSSCPQLLTPQGFLVQDWMEVSFPKHSRSSIQIGPLPPPYEDPVSTTPPLYSIKQSITKLCLIWSNMEILPKGFKICHCIDIPLESQLATNDIGLSYIEAIITNRPPLTKHLYFYTPLVSV